MNSISVLCGYRKTKMVLQRSQEATAIGLKFKAPKWLVRRWIISVFSDSSLHQACMVGCFINFSVVWEVLSSKEDIRIDFHVQALFSAWYFPLQRLVGNMLAVSGLACHAPQLPDHHRSWSAVYSPHVPLYEVKTQPAHRCSWMSLTIP